MPERLPQTDPLLAAQRMGEWLHGFQWDHFVTLTFRRGASVAGALAAFARWHRWITRSAGTPVPHFVVAEGDSAGTGVHLHVLIAGTAALSTTMLAEAWKHGHTRVLIYDSRRGASFYVSKQISAGAEWDMSHRLPP